MATLRQIAYNLRNIIEGGRISDDDVPSYRQVVFMINYYRAMMIRRDLERNYDLSQDIQQDLGCVDMISVDKAECCELCLDCDILRTELKIPKPIRTKKGPAITFIGSLDKQHRFDLILSDRAPFITSSTYTGNVPRAYYLNEYIYTPNTNSFSAINIRGAWTNPEDVKRFQKCEDGSCYTDESEYPFSDDMIQGLTQGILNGELKFLEAMANDVENNALGSEDTQR